MQSLRASVCRCVRYQSNVTASVGAGVGRSRGGVAMPPQPLHQKVRCTQPHFQRFERMLGHHEQR
jgi:hypothetical protein